MAEQKYRYLSEKIEEYIRTQHISGKLPGVRSLSSMFSANKITISKALHDLEKKGVVTICGTGGTYVSVEKKEESYTIGIVGLDETRHTEQLYSYLSGKLKKSGLKFVGLYYNFNEKPELLSKFPVDGYIFLGSYGSRKIFEYLHEHNIPVIGSTFFDYKWLNRVTYDHEGGYRKLLRYLKKLGHRKIALLDTARRFPYRSYTNLLEKIFCKELGEDFEKELISFIPQEKWRDHEYMMQLFHKFRNKGVTCIVGPTRIKELYHLLRSEGIRVPQDISLVMTGYKYVCTPGFTALEAPVGRLLRNAASLLTVAIQNKNAPPGKLVTELILREGKSVMDLTREK